MVLVCGRAFLKAVVDARYFFTSSFREKFKATELMQ